MADDQKELDQKELTLGDIEQKWKETGSRIEETVLACLKEQYQREFEITRTAVSPGEMLVRLYARRTDAEELPFLVHMDAEGMITDQYVRRLVLSPLCHEAEKRFPGIRMTAAILEDPSVPEYDTSLTLFEYLRKHEVDRIVADVIIDEESGAAAEAMLPFFEEESCSLGAELVVDFRILQTEKYERAARMFSITPEVSDAFLAHFDPLKLYAGVIREGKSDFTELEVMTDG